MVLWFVGLTGGESEKSTHAYCMESGLRGHKTARQPTAYRSLGRQFYGTREEGRMQEDGGSMFFQKRRFPKNEILPWGAEVFHSVSTVEEGAKKFELHTFRIPHYFSEESGIKLVMPDICTNAEGRASFKCEGGFKLEATSYVSLRDPQVSDVVFFSGGLSGYQNVQRSVAFVYGRNGGWGRLDGYPKVSGPIHTHEDKSRFGFHAINGLPSVVVAVFKGQNFTFGETTITVQDHRWGDSGYLPVSSDGVLNFIGGKLDFASMWCLSQRNVRGRIAEYEERLKRSEEEATRLRDAGIQFADAVWEGRGVSSSETFAIPRREFEGVLGLQRIEKGRDKGKLLSLPKKDAASIETETTVAGPYAVGCTGAGAYSPHESAPSLLIRTLSKIDG